MSAFPARIANFWSERRAIAKAKATSHAIDVQLEEDARTFRKQAKVLLLGELLHTLFLTRFLVNDPSAYRYPRVPHVYCFQVQGVPESRLL